MRASERMTMGLYTDPGGMQDMGGGEIDFSKGPDNKWDGGGVSSLEVGEGGGYRPLHPPVRPLHYRPLHPPVDHQSVQQVLKIPVCT
jgi:hypothetical protein